MKKYDPIIARLRFDVTIAQTPREPNELLEAIQETFDEMVRMMIFDRLVTPDERFF